VVLATLTATADRLCGATLAARSLSGQASAERVLVPSHPAFDLGSVTCQVNGPFGGAVLLRNPSTSPVTFTATLVADAGTWTLTPTTGSVPPGAVAQLEVRTPVLADVPTIAGAGNALVEVTSSQGTLRLPIDIAPRGADVTGVAAPGRTADELVVGLVNVGARRATLSLTFVADPGASVMATPTSSPVVVEAFSSTFVTVTRSAGTGAGELRLGPVSGAGEVCRANPVRLMF
jgi:hypothetical protein